MKKLSFFQKFAYSMGGLAMNLTNLVIAQWIFKRYTDPPNVMLVGAMMMSAVFFSGRVTDAITDPIIGNWSDNLRSRWGRRIPFILFGTLPFAIIFFLLWTPPSETMGWVNTVYVFVMVQLYFIFYTIVVTPYLALLPEITSNLKERVNITTFQAVFVMLGTILFVLMGVIKEHGGWIAFGAVVSILTIISFYPTVFFVKEKEESMLKVSREKEDKMSLTESISLTIKNRPFLYLVISTSFYWFGLNLLLMLIPYWVQNYLGLTESAVSVIMGPFLVSNLIFFFVFNWIAKEKGKFIAFQFMALGSAIAVPVLSLGSFFLDDNLLLYSAIVMGFAGIPIAGFSLIPFAVISDIVDYDETISGKRREAIFFGVQAIFQKTMIGFSIFSFGIVAMSGDSVSIKGLLTIPLIASAAFVMAFLVFSRYGIREKDGNLYYHGVLIERKE